jgi:hypothetical protein
VLGDLRLTAGAAAAASSAGVSVSVTTTVASTPITDSQPNSRIAAIGESALERKPAMVVSPVSSTASQTRRSACATASGELARRSSRSTS